MAEQIDIIKNEVELVDSEENPISVVHNTVNKQRALITNLDESQCSFSEEYSSDQTNLVIITPAEGDCLHIHGIYCATDGTSGEVHIDFLTSGKKVFRMYITKENMSAMSTLNICGEIDEPLSLTTTAGADKNIFVIVNYMCS